MEVEELTFFTCAWQVTLISVSSHLAGSNIFFLFTELNDIEEDFLAYKAGSTRSNLSPQQG